MAGHLEIWPGINGYRVAFVSPDPQRDPAAWARVEIMGEFRTLSEAAQAKRAAERAVSTLMEGVI